MKDEHVEEELLQRYYDGALEPKRAAEITQHLSACSSCGARHQVLLKLGQAISMAADESARGVDFDALFSRIERGVSERPAPSVVERLSVSFRERMEQRSRQVWLPLAGAVAAAAALLLFLQVQAPRVLPSRGTGAPGELGQGPVTGTASSSEVEQVDFGGNAGTVFQISLPEGISTPVVWINDDSEPNEE